MSEYGFSNRIRKWSITLDPSSNHERLHIPERSNHQYVEKLASQKR
jgi:hypothetical protein